jgi:4-amino-4-deoxy-L-arabinose transferase-like glycosyltransferase
LFFIILAGLLIRLVVIVFLRHFPLLSDALAYHSNALQFLQGRYSYFYWPPGISLYLALFYLLAGASETMARLAMLLFYLALCFGVFLLVKEIANRRAANLAVLFLACYPECIYLSVTPLSQLPTAALLVLFAYWLILACRRANGLIALANGLNLGFIVLIRSSSLPLIIFAFVETIRKTKKLFLAILMAVVAIAIISTWILKIYDATGHFVMINSANSMNFFYGNNQFTPLYKTWWLASHSSGKGVPPEFIELKNKMKQHAPHAWDKFYYQASLSHILARPDLFLFRSFNRICAYFAFDTFAGSALVKFYHSKKLGLAVILINCVLYVGMLFLSILFLYSFKKMDIAGDNLAIILWTVFIYSAPYFISFSHPTFHFPILPFIGAFAAIFLERLSDPLVSPRIKFRNIFEQQRLSLGVVLALFLFIQVEWIALMIDSL